ncbi:MAG: hypothetical protein ACJ79H_10070 [Myxococcales bacterium]
MLSTAEWLSLVVSLGGSLAFVAVSFGSLRARVVALEEKIREHRDQETRSNEDQGRRIGALERWQEGVEKVDADRRRRTRTGAVPVPEEDT